MLCQRWPERSAPWLRFRGVFVFSCRPVQRSSRYLNRWNLQGKGLAFPTAVPAESERPILIVDDDDSRAYLETVLQIEGYRVATAANGEEALAVARQEHPRPILLDLMMPQMDGFAFALLSCAIPHLPRFR